MVNLLVLRFQTAEAGGIRAIRYYRAPSGIGAHIGTLWSADGSVLARAIFNNETASGWQQVALDRAVPVTAGTNYVVSVNANEFFAETDNFFDQPAAVNSSVTPKEGLFGDLGSLPTNNYLNANYYRDVVFVNQAGVQQPLLANPLPRFFNSPVVAPREEGVRFTSQVPGTIEAIRYFRASQDTVTTHVGHVWSTDGTLLASVTFTNETTSGYQEARLEEPLAIESGVEYVVSVNSAASANTGATGSLAGYQLWLPDGGQRSGAGERVRSSGRVPDGVVSERQPLPGCRVFACGGSEVAL